MRFLVTAGNTRELIDSVRDWGNIFTGNTGLNIARALAQLAPVDLLTSNRYHIADLQANPTRTNTIQASAFTSHPDLKGAISALLARNAYQAVFMCAAVADYQPDGTYTVIQREVEGSDGKLERWLVQNVQSGKVKSSFPNIAVLGKPTEKLIDLFRTEWGFGGLLIKFKLEVDVAVDQLLKIGENSRLASGADYLVANTLEMVRGETPGAYLLWEGGHEWVSRKELPGRMVRLVEESTRKPPVQ